jgi:Ca2+-binding EF-hand superfamily protein
MRSTLTTTVISAAALAFFALGSTAFAQTAPAPAQAASSAKPHQRHGGKLQSLDTNQDGNISREEAKGRPRLVKNFDAIDSNKDGQLSREELKAAHQARKDKTTAPR